MEPIEREQIAGMVRQELRRLIPELPPEELDLFSKTFAPSIYRLVLPDIMRQAATQLAPRILAASSEVTLDGNGVSVGSLGKSEFDVLNFVDATATIESAAEGRRVNIRTSSAGLICYDYLVTTCWATQAAALGLADPYTATLFDGCTVKITSTVKKAVDDIISLNGDQWYHVGICPGSYTDTVSWPGSTSGAAVDGVALIGLAGAGSIAGGSLNHVVSVGPTSGSSTAHAIVIANGNPCAMYLENLALRGSSSAQSLRNNDLSGGGGGLNLSAIWHDVYFQRLVNFDSASVRAVNCSFDSGITLLADDAPDHVFFLNCYFGDTVSWPLATVNDWAFTSCRFNTGGNGAARLGGGGTVRFISCFFDATVGTDNILYTTSTQQLTHLTIDDCDFNDKPASNQAVIRLQPTAGAGAAQEVADVTITNNRFHGGWNSATGATTALIKLIGTTNDPIRRPIISHNTFGGDANDESSFIEDQGGFSVIGDFVNRGVFANNAPTAKALYLLTNYTFPKVDGVLWGSGAPTHTDNYGTFYKNTATDDLYQQATDPTGNSWTLLVPGGGAAASFTPRYNAYLTGVNLDSWLEGALITPAAGTLTLGTDGDVFHVGAGNFSAIATPTRQTLAVLVYDGVSVLTNGANLILQSATNYTSAAGDVSIFLWEGSTVWREVNRWLATAAAAGGSSAVSMSQVWALSIGA